MYALDYSTAAELRPMWYDSLLQIDSPLLIVVSPQSWKYCMLCIVECLGESTWAKVDLKTCPEDEIMTGVTCTPLWGLIISEVYGRKVCIPFPEEFCCNFSYDLCQTSVAFLCHRIWLYVVARSECLCYGKHICKRPQGSIEKLGSITWEDDVRDTYCTENW